MNSMLDQIINTITEKINTIPLNEPVFLYIGVGASAGLRDEHGNLELKNYHQYPPFLQHLANLVPNLHTFIILIDPYQENPPYMVKDKNLILNNDNENIECYALDNLAVYTLRQGIYTDPYEQRHDYLNITAQLRQLNIFSIENNITMLYHDFSGRKNALLAEYFDEELGEHLDHIVYGLSAREDHGCYFDLTDERSYFPFKFSSLNKQRILIKLFNIFKFTTLYESIKEELAAEVKNYPPYMHNMITNQKEQIIKEIKSELRNDILSNLRIIARLITGAEKVEDITNVYFFNALPELEKKEALILYHENMFPELFDYLIYYYGKKLDIVSKIKEMDISGREILEFVIHGAEPYDWYKNLDNFF